jgi:hypothetical protein
MARGAEVPYLGVEVVPVHERDSVLGGQRDQGLVRPLHEHDVLQRRALRADLDVLAGQIGRGDHHLKAGVVDDMRNLDLVCNTNIKEYSNK